MAVYNSSLLRLSPPYIVQQVAYLTEFVANTPPNTALKGQRQINRDSAPWRAWR